MKLKSEMKLYRSGDRRTLSLRQSTHGHNCTRLSRHSADGILNAAFTVIMQHW